MNKVKSLTSQEFSRSNISLPSCSKSVVSVHTAMYSKLWEKQRKYQFHQLVPEFALKKLFAHFYNSSDYCISRNNSSLCGMLNTVNMTVSAYVLFYCYYPSCAGQC